ncbi:MAG: DUF2252 family protein [Polyangiaceae bacterium]
MPQHLDPTSLARAQLEFDRRATSRFRGLLEHKIERVTASPFAFLRGSAPLFYSVLAARPDLASGPAGEGWISGDLHMENFGAYRTDDHSPTSRVVYGLNDFDEAIVAPWRIDVLRLTTSLLLATRGFGIDGVSSTGIAFSLLSGYARACATGKAHVKTPAAVATLIEQVRTRTRKQLLDARTETHHGERRFVRGVRYRDISRALAKDAAIAFDAYVRSTFGRESAKNKDFRVIDVAQRIAGTGSLGCLRIAVLTEGKGGVDGAFVFDMKEENASAAARFGRSTEKNPAARVIAGAHALLEHPPRMMGVTRLGKSSMLARRLAPQEDKLDLSRSNASELAEIAALAGTCAGAAHERGATKAPKKKWSELDCEAMLARAMELAGIHEASYLAYSRLARAKSTSKTR